MAGVDEIDGLVILASPVEGLFQLVGAEEGDVARLAASRLAASSTSSSGVARPLPDAAPAFDAIVAGDLACAAASRADRASESLSGFSTRPPTSSRQSAKLLSSASR